MNAKSCVGYILFFLLPVLSFSQVPETKKFTHADTLRGSITPERAWWDLQQYEIAVEPDIANKTINGAVLVRFKALKNGTIMQIDLQQPLLVDSVLLLGTKQLLKVFRDSNVAMIEFPKQITKGTLAAIKIYYHGKPKEAVRPPWDGGISWKMDDEGSPFVATSCQGIGASVWWPCKDHQYDEPELGVIIAVRVPDTLMDVSNGRLIKTEQHADHTKTYTWQVKNPINNYSVSMNIGKYVLLQDEYQGEGGKLSLDYYVLKANKDSALKQFAQVKPMLQCFEHWFGKYPFYEDGYKIVEVPYLGMEHQSNMAYGNKYKNGYLGRDLSGTGWGLKWDYIIIHESGHEWFSNNITSEDIADMWIHEGFTTYSETLFTECQDGKDAGNEYNKGSRKNIKNNTPVIGIYNVQNEGSGDMYPKASAMIHAIRMGMNDDEKFRAMLRYLNSTFYHKIVTTNLVAKAMNKYTGFSVDKIFNQYLRTTQIPTLEFYVSVDQKKLHYRWIDAVNGFDMPIWIPGIEKKPILKPMLNKWQSYSLQAGDFDNMRMDMLENYFYIRTVEKIEQKIKMN